MEPLEILIVLPGTIVVPGKEQVFIIPEVLNMSEGLLVELNNERNEELAVGRVVSSKVETFALLTAKDFTDSAHPDYNFWHTAFAHLRDSVEDFSQTDKVTVVRIAIEKVADEEEDEPKEESVEPDTFDEGHPNQNDEEK